MEKSVLFGTDNKVIPILIKLHSSASDPLVFDCTYNKGTMWKDLSYNIVKSDVDSTFSVDVVSDFFQMPFRDSVFDVVAYDPPHLPTHAASKNSSKIWERRYGITSKGAGREADNVSGMFMPFLVEAKRVLKENGIILAKIADLVHNHRYQWQHVDFINEVNKVGMTPCDVMIKCDPKAGNLKSSKWRNVKHLRKAHCFWIVVRKSKKCEV